MVLYSVPEVLKQINYFNSCARYEYAGALKNYLNLLTRYNNKEFKTPPVYPSFSQYQPTVPLRYKRPSMYQNAGKSVSVKLTNNLK